MTAALLSIYTRQLADTAAEIDRTIEHGAFMSQASMSALYLRRTEDTLRQLADRIAGQRLRLIEEQPQLPLLRAAE